MKIANNCDIRAIAPALSTNCDVFPANSGSPLLSAGGEVVGVVTTGAGNYRPEGDCRVLTVYNEDGTLPDIPTAPQFNVSMAVGPALTALCQSGSPTALCNTAPACGDGACTGHETETTCASDCTAASCGDQVCDLGEELSCADDCAHLECQDLDATTALPYAGGLDASYQSEQ
jgi:hypothetical protein